MKEKQLRRATTKSPTYGKCNSTFYFFLFFCRLKFANLIGENLTQTLISFIEEIIRAESYEISNLLNQLLCFEECINCKCEVIFVAKLSINSNDDTTDLNCGLYSLEIF